MSVLQNGKNCNLKYYLYFVRKFIFNNGKNIFFFFLREISVNEFFFSRIENYLLIIAKCQLLYYYIIIIIVQLLYYILYIIIALNNTLTKLYNLLDFAL